MNIPAFASGQVAAQAALKELGKPGAVAWFKANCPDDMDGVQHPPIEFWMGFDRELADVAGTA